MSQMSTGLSHQEKQAALAVPPREAGRLLSLGLSEVYERMRKGELESYQDGRARRITMKSIHTYLARRLAASADGWRGWSARPNSPPCAAASSGSVCKTQRPDVSAVGPKIRVIQSPAF